MVGGFPFPGKVCPASPVAAGLTQQCRPLPYFSPVLLEVCHLHLSNTSTYYLLDTPWLDESPFSYIKLIGDFVGSKMTPSCASNAMSWICNSWFRECKQNTDTKEFFPALMCRSECDRHLSVWDKVRVFYH